MLFLTGGEQDDNKGISKAVKREIAQGLQEGHGPDKGIAITAGTCRFFDFETCETIDLNGSNVRLLSLHDAARRAMRPAPAVRILASRR